MTIRFLLLAANLLAACAVAPGTAPASAGPPEGVTPRANPEATPARYENGLWYVADEAGVRFEPGARCQAGGVFVADCPDGAAVIELNGAYLIPPLGEAHNHNLDGPWTAPMGQRYLRDGVFFMKNTNSVNSIDAWAAEAWETPETVDIAWTHAGLSVDEGHPEKLYRTIADVYRLDPEKLEGEVFWDMADLAALDAKWPDVLATEPDWIKLYLLDVDQEVSEGTSGLSAEVFAAAVQRAEASSIPTTVHVYTAADYALAVEAGANEAAHMPPTFIRNSAYEKNPDLYTITQQMAEEAAAAGFVTTTTTLVNERGQMTESPRYEETRRVQAANLATLKAAGARLAVGSDRYQDTGLDEALNLATLGPFTTEEVLRLAVETPGLAIFPDRAIGTLATGWEASFVAVPCDPREDLTCIRRATHRVKQGLVLSVEGTAEAD